MLTWARLRTLSATTSGFFFQGEDMIKADRPEVCCGLKKGRQHSAEGHFDGFQSKIVCVKKYSRVVEGEIKQLAWNSIRLNFFVSLLFLLFCFSFSFFRVD